MNFDTILKAGLLMALILPALAIVSGTLPMPTSPYMPMNQSNAIVLGMNNTARQINYNFMKTVTGLNSTLLSPTNGSFFANPTIFQAFAFILSGFGTVMTDIVYLPYLDVISMNYIASGFSLGLPISALYFVHGGITLLYGYMLLSMFLLGISAIEKYNMREGILIPLLPLSMLIHNGSSFSFISGLSFGLSPINILALSVCTITIIGIVLYIKKGNKNE